MLIPNWVSKSGMFWKPLLGWDWDSPVEFHGAISSRWLPLSSSLSSFFCSILFVHSVILSPGFLCRRADRPSQRVSFRRIPRRSPTLALSFRRRCSHVAPRVLRPVGPNRIGPNRVRLVTAACIAPTLAARVAPVRPSARPPVETGRAPRQIPRGSVADSPAQLSRDSCAGRKIASRRPITISRPAAPTPHSLPSLHS